MKRGGRSSRHIHTNHDQYHSENQIPKSPDSNARECDEEHAVDRLEDGVVHRAVTDGLVEFFGVGPDQRDHQGVDETEDAQQCDEFAQAPTAKRFGVAEDDIEREQFPAEPHEVKQNVDDRIGAICQ